MRTFFGEITRLFLVFWGLFTYGAAYGVIIHSGDITQDTTWDATDTHLVNGDVRILPGVSLTVLPGAQIAFTAGTDGANLGIDVSRTELIVDGGRLVVAGTAASPVTLTSDGASPAAGDWQGIRVVNGGEVELRNAVVEYAATGLDYRKSGAVSGAPVVEGVVFRQLSGTGMYFDARGGAQLNVTVRNATVGPVGSRGIHLYSQDNGSFVQGIVEGSTVSNTGLNGIYVNGSGGSRNELTLRNNVVHTTGGGTTVTDDRVAVRLYNNSSPYATTGQYTRYVVTGNEIYGSGASGFYQYSDYSNVRTELRDNVVHDNAGAGLWERVRLGDVRTEAVHNTVYGNGGAGLRLQDSYSDMRSDYGVTVLLNEVRNNGGDGVMLRARNASSVVHNTVHDNAGRGVYVQSPGLTRVNFNNIYANTGLALTNDAGGAVDARYNWWGGLTAEITGSANPKNLSGIYDVYDDPTRGSVDYGQWLVSQQAEPLPVSPRSWVKSPVDGVVMKAARYTIEGSASSGSAIDRVEVSTDDGVTWTVATGTVSWRYEWTVPSGDGSYRIRSRVVTRDGVIETAGAGNLVTIDATYKTTSGILSADETWSGTVDLTGDVVVPEGVTLTLLPGTVIRFPALRDDRGAGIDPSRVELNVQGSLIAVGTDTQPITLTSDAAVPATGDWTGIRVSGNATLENVRIEYGNFGVHCLSRAPPAACTIRASRIGPTAGRGVFFDANGSGTHTFVLENTLIRNNASQGVYVYANRLGTNVNARINGNTINDNGAVGLYAYAYNYANLVADISRNTIFSNATHGIHARATSYGRGDITIDRNVVHDITGGNGIYLETSYAASSTRYTVSSNEVYNNATGIKAYNYRTTLALSLTANTAHDNAYNGIETGFGSASTLVPVFDGNIAYNNNTGIRIGATAPVALPNHQLYANYYDLANTTANAVDATGAWWGVDTTNLLATGTHPRNMANLYDSFDDAALGTIDYAGWLTAINEPPAPVLTAVQSPTSTPVQTIGGTKAAGTGIAINGNLVVPVDAATTWSHDLALTEGANSLAIYAVNDQGIHSPTVNAEIVLDTLGPQVFATTPANGAVLNTAVGVIEVVLYEPGSRIDADATLARSSVVDADNAPVPGNWSLQYNQLRFVPASPLAPGSYTVSIVTSDLPLGNTTNYNFGFTIDTAAPTPVTLDPVTSPVTASPVTLSGTKEAGTAVYINGVLAVTADAATTWRVDQPLVEGGNTLSLVARDAAGNDSPAVDVTIVLDSVSPAVTNIVPAPGSVIPLRPANVTVTFQEATSGLDTASTIAGASVTRGNGATVAGTWTLDAGDRLIFTPATAFTEDTYTITASLRDNAGNVTPLNTRFTYDATPPALPSFNPVTSPTNARTQALGGTKEPGSSLWINGTEVVPPDPGSTWAYTIELQPGVNRLDAYSRDAAGNQSGTVSVEIVYDDVAPLPVTALTVDATGNGTTARMDWRGYDETVHGDIAGYRVYVSASLFTNVSGLSPAISLPAGNRTYDVTGLTKGRTYYFAVVAYDNNGNSNPSVTPVTAVPSDNQPPEDVTDLRLTVQATSLTLGWTPSANTRNDLSGYRVYFNNDGGTDLPATATSHTITGLTPATRYPLRITAVDTDGNESPGVTLDGVTLLENPANLATTPYSGMVELTWSAVQPAAYVRHYAIYAAETPFTDVTGMTPRITVPANRTTARIAGLSNNTRYYLAVTTVNLSGGERSAVSPVSETPVPDTTGPELGVVRFNGSPLASGATVTQNGRITVTATDPSGIGRIAFLVDGTPLGTDTNGADGYGMSWDIQALADGNHTLRIRAYDTLDNVTDLDIPLVIALAPPPAPVITAPAAALLTNESRLQVEGTAEPDTRVQLYLNGTPAGAVANSGMDGRFSLTLTLAEGANRIEVTAANRGGEGPRSDAVTVTLDTSLPDAPGGLIATAQAGGEIRLGWNRPAGSDIVSYDVYRAAQPFTDVSAAQKINTSPVRAEAYTDMPATDGTYYYRVVSINAAGTASQPSNPVSIEADSTPPVAVSIEYTPTGALDPATGRMAPGDVAVTLVVSEPLLTTPFLSIAPENGVPLTVNLVRTRETEYTGTFTIRPTTPSGTAYAVFSARDRVGNRGTTVQSGATLQIDAAGPDVISLTVEPATPIRNDQASPVTVRFGLVLSEPLAEGQSPLLSYRLSGAGRSPIVIDNLTRTDIGQWHGSFTLPADAGLAEVEELNFLYQGTDDLGNVSTRIQVANRFQIYQGDLPPLATPTGLNGTPEPGGRIRLAWQPVEGAAAYQIYRQAPGETELAPYRRVAETTYQDATGQDGDYRYSVASVRQENGQEGLSTTSPPVTVTADSVASPAPGNLALELTGSGIRATWDAPAGNEPLLTYRLYRSAAEITGTSGLAPVLEGIGELAAVDATPSETEHYYAVTAVDAAGNESPVSASAYLNFDLLPVSNFEVAQIDEALPVLTWQHNGTTIAGYNLFLGQGPQAISLNGNGLLTATTYTDSGYRNDTRTYTLHAVDTNGVQSVGRTLVLPRIVARLTPESQVQRGVFNRIEYAVTNASNLAIDNIRLRVDLEGRQHVSAPFALAAGETTTIPVIVGGFANLPDLSKLITTIEIVPNPGERVRIVRNREILIADSALVVDLVTEAFTRGGEGQVRFTLENTSDVETEVVLATGGGRNPSGELRVRLVDADGNVLATAPVFQDSGTGVVRLSNGDTVARIAPGATFTSAPLALPVPASAPENVRVRLEIDKYHHRLGRADHVAIAGRTARRAVRLIDTRYYGAVDSVTPAVSYGQADVVITGHAVDRETGQPLPSVPLELVITVNGFERTATVFTDGAGNFTHTFVPLAGESGLYRISVLHPDLTGRPEHGRFVIRRVAMRNDRFEVNIPRNYDQRIAVPVETSEGTTATNLRLVFDAADQPNGTLPAGITVTPEAPISLAGGETGELGFVLRADATALDSGRLYLRLISDESGAIPLGRVEVNYAFSEAVPVLRFEPNYVETGLAQGSSISETATLANRGLAVMENVQVALTNPDGSPAPGWIFLTTPAQLGDLAVGESRPVTLSMAPDAALADGIYEYRLRVTAANHNPVNINVFVAVTQSGEGGVLFKVSDIYTATLDANNQLIQGLAGARITVQNERVPTIRQTLATDANGETLFSNLPAGWYKFRATAPNHQEQLGRFRIKAGITISKPVFLNYNLVTVEWSVTEITLQDKYQITLNATYETQVPAAVVVVDPPSVVLPPNMAPGDVFYGEFTLTNRGLIRADNLQVTVPASDEYFRYELLGGLPDSLAAEEQIVVPYRVIALKAVTPGATSGTGGAACSAYMACADVGYDYECANGTIADGTGRHCWTVPVSAASCGDTATRVVPTIRIGSGSTPSIGVSGTPNYTSMEGAKCTPDCEGCCPFEP